MANKEYCSILDLEYTAHDEFRSKFKDCYMRNLEKSRKLFLYLLKMICSDCMKLKLNYWIYFHIEKRSSCLKTLNDNNKRINWETKAQKAEKGRDFLGIIQGFVPPKAGLVRSKKDNPIVRVCKTLR